MVLQRTGLLYVMLSLLCIGILAAGIMTDSLLIILIAIALTYGLFLSLRYPFIPLVAYSVAIPFEDILRVGGIFNTLTKGFGLLFAAVYLITHFRQIKFNLIPAVWWVWLVWNIASILWTPDAFFAAVWFSVATYVQLFFMLVLMVNLLHQNPKRIPILLAFYSIATTITSLYSIVNFMQGADLTEGTRTGAFEEQSVAHFAAMIIPGLLYLIHCVLHSKSILLRVGLIPIALIQITAVILSGTRSAWMGLAAALLFMLLANFNWKKAVAVILVSGIVLFGVTSIPELEHIITARSEQAVDSGGSGRTMIWEHAIGVFADHLIIGTGSGTYHKYQEYPPYGAHNIYLGAAIQTGIIGLALMLASLWRTFRASSESNLNLLLKGLLIAYMVESFFLETTIMKYFWFVIGLSLGAGILKIPTRRSRALKQKEPVQV
ncbi:O-antigen ligase family protein [Paenibacillus baimaensis]|uniref:O-antigen ligase family protein n=1 Tax=Paenibacillus baimaensis TaxID=2982185 RepID=UPI0021D1F282|nr:O-antigen ligase family protein [Paenibacillus sp. WQ 127069]